MNTADRGIRAIDIALRRRFDVFECPPSSDALTRYYDRTENTNEVSNLIEGFEALNLRLTEELDRHHTIGHTFFMHPKMDEPKLTRTWNHKIGPFICYGDSLAALSSRCFLSLEDV